MSILALNYKSKLFYLNKKIHHIFIKSLTQFLQCEIIRQFKFIFQYRTWSESQVRRRKIKSWIPLCFKKTTKRYASSNISWRLNEYAF